MKKDNHTQAFPVPGLSGLPNDMFIQSDQGMSLRDYFAAKAMQAYITSGKLDSTFKENLAHNAYSMADHMMEQREI